MPDIARPGGAVSIAAPAKINLYLHVLGRRADGYHEIESLAAFAAINDELVLRPARRLGMTIDGPFSAGLALSGNLVLRAAQALGGGRGAHIHLRKNLPVAAGLGGGSTDAAAALIGLNRLWRLGLDREALAAIGAPLGADIPVCLARRPSRMTGTGTRIAPAPALPAAGVVLVNPIVPVSTAMVYRARRGGGSKPHQPPDEFSDFNDLCGYLGAARNDLEGPASEVAPVILSVLAALRSDPACRLARMCGSGASCFGLFADLGDAAAAAARLRSAHPGWWIRHGGWFTHEETGAPALC